MPISIEYMHGREKDISRRDAKAQSKGEEEKQIRQKQRRLGERVLLWLDRPILFLPFAPLRLCASFLFSIPSDSTFDGNHIIAKPHPGDPWRDAQRRVSGRWSGLGRIPTPERGNEYGRNEDQGPDADAQGQGFNEKPTPIRFTGWS